MNWWSSLLSMFVIILLCPCCFQYVSINVLNKCKTDTTHKRPKTQTHVMPIHQEVQTKNKYTTCKMPGESWRHLKTFSHVFSLRGMELNGTNQRNPSLLLSSSNSLEHFTRAGCWPRFEGNEASKGGPSNELKSVLVELMQSIYHKHHKLVFFLW